MKIDSIDMTATITATIRVVAVNRLTGTATLDDGEREYKVGKGSVLNLSLTANTKTEKA